MQATIKWIRDECSRQLMEMHREALVDGKPIDADNYNAVGRVKDWMDLLLKSD